MIRKLAMAIIAFPTVLFLIAHFGLQLPQFLMFFADHAFIFWAVGAAIMIYTFMPYAWVLVIAVLVIYLTIRGVESFLIG